MAKREEPKPTTAEENGEARPRGLGRRTIACVGCGVVFVVVAIVGIILASVWDTKESRLYHGKTMPSNVAYIGYWVSDKTLGARIDTFAITANNIACDFAVRNDGQQPVTIKSIGRTIIAPPLDNRMVEIAIPVSLFDGDEPMRVTDDENVLGLQYAMQGQWVLLDPQGASSAPQPEPFTLKPGEIKRVRYRPLANQLLMPASALRIAVLLDDGGEPHPFYFLRQSCGIAGVFERTFNKAVERGAERR